MPNSTRSPADAEAGVFAPFVDPLRGKPMTDHDALLRAILDDPRDDAVRLVYADWLEERGDPDGTDRAEFIRGQCELECLPLGSPRRRELEARCDDLLAEHEEPWLGPIPACLEEWTFRRGFIESLTLREEPSLDPCGELFRRHPIRSVHLHCGGKVALRLRQSPWHERLDDLYLTITTDEMDFLAGAQSRADFPTITGLCDFDCGVIDDPLALRELPLARSLRRLELLAWDDHPEGLGGLRPLLADGAFPELTALAIQWSDRATAEELAPLLGGERRDRWTRLALLGPLFSEDIRQFARCTCLESLELRRDETVTVTPLELPPNLTELSVTDRAAAGTLLPTLARARGLERLRALRLRLGWFGQPAALAPGDVPALGEILARLPGPALQLELYGFGEGTLSALARLPHLDRLTGLSLQEDSVVKEAELPALLASPLAGLLRLRLPLRNVTTAGLRLLAGAPGLAGLRTLSLIEGGILQEGLQALLESPHLRRLRRLDLYGLHGEHSATLLAGWPGLRRLRELDVRFRNSIAAGVRPFLESPHLSPLLRLHLGAWLREGAERLPLQDLQGLRARLGCRLETYGDLSP